MDGIWTPQLNALLVLLRNAEARVDNVEMLEATGEQKVLVKDLQSARLFLRFSSKLSFSRLGAWSALTQQLT
jgi:hypothetical protein